jgi:excisionase family DNA binding protein
VIGLPLTVYEAAQFLSVSERRVRQLVRDGELHAGHIGRDLRFSLVELERFLRGDPRPESDVERMGSVKVTMNAKHEPQFEVKVYVGDSADDLAAARALAVAEFRTLEQEFGLVPAAAEESPPPTEGIGRPETEG